MSLIEPIMGGPNENPIWVMLSPLSNLDKKGFLFSHRATIAIIKIIERKTWLQQSIMVFYHGSNKYVLYSDFLLLVSFNHVWLIYVIM